MDVPKVEADIDVQDTEAAAAVLQEVPQLIGVNGEDVDLDHVRGRDLIDGKGTLISDDSFALVESSNFHKFWL